MDTDRVEFLLGADALDHLDDYDLDDEGDRIELVDRFAGPAEDTPQRTTEVLLRTVAINQMLEDEPPETWQTAQRLSGMGFDREAVFSQLSLVIGDQLRSRSAFDAVTYAEALDALPLPDMAEIARALVELARDRPGIYVEDHIDEALESLGAADNPLAERMVDAVLDELVQGPLHWLPGDRTVVVPDLIDARTFTHRLNESEAQMGVLAVAFDLGAMARIDTVRLDDGNEVDQFSLDAQHLGWSGPGSWLERFSPGDLLACSVVIDDDGVAGGPVEATVSIETLDPEPVADPAVLGSVRDGYDELVAEPGLPVDGSDLSWWLLFHHPELFDSAQLPLVELCEQAGLDVRGRRVAHSEEVWRTQLAAQRSYAAMELVPERHWRLALARALEVLDDPDASVEAIRSALDECAEPETLDVLADVLFDHYLEPDDELDRSDADAPGRLLELVERATAAARRPREVATAEYLACVLRERSGDPEAAEVHLQRAAEAQPRLGPVVERLGWYRFDRGDAKGAMRWWRTLSELPEAARTIEPFLKPGEGSQKLGRNDPCWCGSGRKFKRCHQDAGDLPALPDRVGWLCRKATLWLEHTTGEVRNEVTELLLTRALGDPDPDLGELSDLDEEEMAELFGDAGADPIVFDTALNEGDLFGLFLYERRALLPADEQLLAASWSTVDRSVHEVVSVDAGVGLTLRDLATGDINEVRERTASRQMSVGERYCARIVPDGATNQIAGACFPVRTGHEATVLDLCDEGDPVALCAWVGALDQPPRIQHTPGMAEDLFDREAVEAVLAEFGEDSDPTEAMEALQVELARQADARWLDDHIPALGGLTPREAAADPTRREQLERLLAEMESRHVTDLPDGFEVFTHDVAALRRELGLG